MRKVTVFDSITLDGYFTGEGGDLGWAHENADDAEWNEFVAGNAKGEGALLFGRITYQMMASYWPTPAAKESAPEVAEGMNRMPKYVASKTLDHVSWSNTTVIEDLVPGVRKLKSEPGPDLVVLGSGSIVAQLAKEQLIDLLQLVLTPIAIGSGRTLFEGVSDPLRWRLTESRAFRNGRVVLWYEPA